MRRHKVIVEVYGGVATVTSCPPEVKVKVIETDDKGRVRLSMKAVAAEAAPAQ